MRSYEQEALQMQRDRATCHKYEIPHFLKRAHVMRMLRYAIRIGYFVIRGLNVLKFKLHFVCHGVVVDLSRCAH